MAAIKSTTKNVSIEKEIKELKSQLNKLPKDNPKVCEGLIRELYKRISKITEENVKEQVLFQLKEASCHGLNIELRTLVEQNGLNMEALHLVLKYLTTREELAQYFFTHPKDTVENDGLDAIRTRLGPKLEVLGGLCANGIDVTKDWVKNLFKMAPSLQSLSRILASELEKVCNEANDLEKEVVDRLVKIAECRARKIAASQDVQENGTRDRREKAIDQEKFEKAKALINEAKEKAKQESEEAKKAVNEKLAEITKILQLPPDWNKHNVGVKPEQLFEQLNGIIEQLENVVEVGEAYKSELEVVRKASGGRALCGIYHSEYMPPMTAELPIIIMPNELILSSPNNSHQVRYVKFSRSRVAADYVQTVKSSSSNIGLRVSGFLELFVGDICGSYASKGDEEKTTSEKMQTSSASVVQYIWIATKTFKIEQEQLRLSRSAKKMARSVVKDEETARRFMKRYGSHFPAGLHTLGGILFRIVDAESSSMKATSVLAEKAAQQLQGQISVGLLNGLFGTGGTMSGEHGNSSGKTKGHDEESDDVSYTFSSQAMGPATTKPVAFSKLLANNSTWALIDRGSRDAYLPVWELIRDLGSDFQEAAQILEETWSKDEAERKQEIEAERKQKIEAERKQKKVKELKMAQRDESWQDKVREKLVEVFKESPEDLCGILSFLDDEDKAYKDNVSRPYAPQWKSLKATMSMNDDKAFRKLAKRLAKDTKKANKDQQFRRLMNTVYEQMTTHCENAVAKEKYQKFDADRLCDYEAPAVSAFSGLAKAWSKLPVESKADITNYIRTAASKVGTMAVGKDTLSAVDEVVSLLVDKSSGTRVMVGLAAVYLIYEAYVNIQSWWKGEISGKRCIKNLLDTTFKVGAGVGGGIAGASFGSLAGPVGSLVGGVVGGWISTAIVSYLSDYLTQRLFGLPQDVALENAYRHLRVEMTASNAEVNTAFRKLCLTTHPDKPGGTKEAFFILQCNMATIRQARGEF